ncbi:hypothetical protein O3Q51_02410 [Cryomorphaceae bacterium 1068]|nr:hypothetical protein [Cryomorphaceae bacterium 1068]
MKKLLYLAFALFVLQANAQDDIFVLPPSQSMSITGLGEGQDAAINPYSNEKSIAVVENNSKNEFVIRVQMDGKVVNKCTIKPKETKMIELEKGAELYLDSDKKAKARVSFKKAD